MGCLLYTSDDGIPNGIRRRTDKGYATCYGSGQEKYGNSAPAHEFLRVGAELPQRPSMPLWKLQPWG